MAKRTLTLDIEDTSVRLLEVVGNRVTRWASAPLQEGLVSDGLIRNPAELGAILRDLVQRSGFHGTEVLASMSGSHALSRVVRIPRTSKERLEQSVPREAAQVLPVPLEQLYISWQPLGLEAGEQHILIVAMPREFIDAAVATPRAARLRAAVLSLKSMAVATAADKPDSIVINVSDTAVDVALVMDGMLRSVHTVAQAVDGMSPKQHSRQVAGVLTRAVDYYNSQHVLEPFTQEVGLVVAGRAVVDPEFVRSLADASGHSVETLSPPLEYPPYFPVTEYAVNVGLAMRAVASPKGDGAAMRPITSNLAPQSRSWYRSRRVQSGALVILMGVLGLLYLLTQVLTPVQDRVAFYQEALTQRETARILNDLNNTRRAVAQAKITSFELIGAARGPVSDLLFRMQDLLGPEMIIAAVSLGDDSLTLQVEAPSFLAGEQYMQALRDTELFDEVTSPQQTGSGEEGTTIVFSIQAKLTEPVT